MHMSLFYRKLKAISDVQDTLNHFDVIASVIEHLNCPQDDVVRETLAFLCMLLYNGNENVQVLFIHKCWQRLIAKWKTLAKFRGFLWVHLWVFFTSFCINWYDFYKINGKAKLVYAFNYTKFISTFRAWVIQINME